MLRALYFTALFLSVSVCVADEKERSSEDNLTNLSIEELMQVKVATVTTPSKISEKSTDAPGTNIVISKHDILLRGYSYLKDVLHDLPGMETVEYTFTEYGTNVPVRGIVGNNKIVVLVNGMRVNPPGGEYFPFRSDFSVRQAEQIEIVYGPGSTLYGRDAINAVINVIIKNPSENPNVEIGGDVGLHYEREAWGYFGKVLNEDKHISFTAYAQYHDSDLSRIDLNYPTYWQDYYDVAAPKGAGTVPSRNDLGLNAFGKLELNNVMLQTWFRQSQRSSSEGFLPILGYINEARWGDRSIVTEAKHSLDIKSDLKLDSIFTYNHYEILSGTRYTGPQSETEWILNGYKSGYGNSYYLQEILRAQFSDKTSLLAGLEGGYFDIVPKGDFPVAGRPRPFMYYTEIGNPASLQVVPAFFEVPYWRVGAYAEVKWHAIDPLRFTLGVRLDKDTRIADPSFTPRFTAVYSLSESLMLKYTYAQAYLEPSPYFAYATYDNTQLLATANPGLQPETARTNEIAINYTKTGFNLGISAYYGQQSNLIVPSDTDSAANVVLPTVYLDLAGTQTRTLVEAVNSGESRNLGFDLYGRSSIGAISPWYSYSFVSVRRTLLGQDTGLQGVSRHNGRVGITWGVNQKLFVTPSLVIRSTPENVPPGKLEHELHTPYQIDLFTLFKANQHFDTFLNIKNLTNHKYALGGVAQAIPQETISGVVGVRGSF